MSLKDELKFRQEYYTSGHEALLNVYYTATLLKKMAADFFRKYSMTDVQYNAMIMIKYQGAVSGGLTQVELSRMLLVNRGNVTTLIDRMEKGGFVARNPVADDRRYNRIALTEKGNQVLDMVEEAYKAEIKRITDNITSEDQETINRMMERIRQVIRVGWQD